MSPRTSGHRPHPAVLTGALLLLIGTFPARGGVDRWSGSGPPGGRVTGLSVHPEDPEVLAAGLLGGGVFTSTDGGSSWRPAREGVLALDLLALARSPTDPRVLYAASFEAGAFRSNDGGRTWDAFGAGLEGLHLKALLATAEGSVYAGTSEGRVLRRGAEETSWTDSGPSLGAPVFSLAAAPGEPRQLLAGTANGLFRSTDGGATWIASSAGLPSLFLKFAGFSPDDPQTAWAGSAAGLSVSRDGARTWRASGEGLPEAEVRALAFDSRDRRTLWAAGAAGVFLSRDGGRRWTNRSAGLPQREVNTLRLAAGRLWAGLAGAGVAWSDDDGGTWHRGVRGLDATTVASLAPAAGGPETVWAGTGGLGVVTGRGGGPSWITPGVPPADGPVTALAALFPRGSSAFLVASFAAAGLFRSGDGGTTWSPIEEPPPAPVVALAGESSRLYAASAAAGVFVSGDQGRTWEKTGTLGEGSLRDLAVAASDPRTVWAAVATGIFRSTDGGTAWTDVGPGTATGVRTLALDPADPATVWAGTFTAGVLVTHDGGGTWEPRNEGLGSLDVRDLAVDSVGTVLAATAGGVSARHAGSVRWETAAPGLPTGDVLAVVADPRVPGRWWAATNGRGVFVLDDARAAPLLLQGRFEARAAWRDLAGGGGAAVPLPLTGSSGAFRVFGTAPDLVLKLLDARPTDGRFWLFAAPLTGAGLTLTVTDGTSGTSRTWDLPPGGRRQVVDLEAF